jgi:hypothetical protein
MKTQDNAGIVRQLAITDCSAIAIPNGRVQCFGKLRAKTITGIFRLTTWAKVGTGFNNNSGIAAGHSIDIKSI